MRLRVGTCWAMIVAVLLSAAGCASHHDRIVGVREAFYSGQLELAAVELDKHKDLRLRNGDVKQLDRAMIALAGGKPAEAEKLLREVRDHFDQNEGVSLLDEAGNLLADENARAYAGEDYEKVFIRAFLALSNLMTTGDDAGAYALQMIDKQQEIIDKAATRAKEIEDEGEGQKVVAAYKQVALGPYIRAVLAEESPLTLDEAARARVQVANWAPDFRDAKADLQRAQFESPHRPGEGTLYVFALVGRGPVKEESAEIPATAALLIADRIISNNSDYGLPPTIAPVKVPRVQTFSSGFEAVRVDVDGRPLGQTAVLMDVGAMAAAQSEAQYNRRIAEAVARRVVKKGAIYAVKQGVDATPWSGASIGLSILGIAWEATETADTRCWSLLPDEIQVLRLQLPVGEHQLSLIPAIGSRPVGSPHATKVTIEQGRHTYVMGFFPDRTPVGELLVSNRRPAPASGDVMPRAE